VRRQAKRDAALDCPVKNSQQIQSAAVGGALQNSLPLDRSSGFSAACQEKKCTQGWCVQPAQTDSLQYSFPLAPDFRFV